jgi:hypothetical protein
VEERRGDRHGRAANERPRLRFAGEQQLTSAILGLSQTTRQKGRVRPVRRPVMISGGGGMMGMGGGPGPFSEIADRLKSYNFDVVEKDLGRRTRCGSRCRPRTSRPTRN